MHNTNWKSVVRRKKLTQPGADVTLRVTRPDHSRLVGDGSMYVAA